MLLDDAMAYAFNVSLQNSLLGNLANFDYLLTAISDWKLAEIIVSLASWKTEPARAEHGGGDWVLSKCARRLVLSCQQVLAFTRIANWLGTRSSWSLDGKP